MTHDVFISYASDDKSLADAVCSALEDAQIACWIAPRDVVAGTRYAEAIVDAIRESRVFLLVFSAAANASVQVGREVDRAASLGLPIVPLRIEDVLPGEALEYYLAGQHWFEAFAPSPEAHLGRLAGTIRTLLTASATTARKRTGPPAALRPARQERRVVTALNASLPTLATSAQQADPEDVDRLLRTYDALVRRVVTAHGGVAHSSAGDAVTAVFGIPVLHEDDAERAVRAGLRLVEEAGNMAGLDGAGCEVRVGVHTGEAFVNLDADPAAGEGFLSGDVLVRAAHLQAAAPPNGVVVSEATRVLTAEAIAYEPLEPAAGGASAAATLWLATAPQRRTGAPSAREYVTPLIGRENELSYLQALFEKAAGSSSPQVALIVGEPGIGKSRLVAELRGSVQSRPDEVTWRQGRCLPYGEGVTFWALGEVFKAHAGILETDDLATAEAKLRGIVPEGPDREWLRNRLRALLGLEAPQASRDENHAAWLRLLEDLTLTGPVVVVIEDLHWADEAMLAFLEYGASNIEDVPLLVIGTARSDLFERHPSFAASIARVNRIALEALSNAETEHLVMSLLEALRVPGEVREAVVVRSEGNPFYAEQSVRLLKDNAVADAPRLLGSAGRGSHVAEGESPLMPGSVQAVIAARLDTLPPEHKAVLAGAAVIGGVFWSGAVAALGDRDSSDVDEALRDLIAKQLVHRVRESSMQGESEFAFWHALARDVAYQQLPRAVRAQKHAAAARWIEGKAGERGEDLADVLAHHYVTALKLARAAGEVELADSLVDPAVRNLSLAGDRARPLDLAAAESLYARALELAGSEGPQRPRLLVKWAKAATELGRRVEAVDAFEEAIARLRAEGDVRAAAIAQMGLAWALPDDDEARSLGLADEAVALLEADGPSPEFVTVLTEWLAITGAQGDSQSALEVADRIVKLAEQLGLPVDARVVSDRGRARCALGDAGGLDDLKLALEMCRTSGLAEIASGVFWSVGTWVSMYEGFRASLAILTEGLETARRRGAVHEELMHRMAIICLSEGAGEWDTVLDDAVAVEPLLEAATYVWALGIVRLYRTLVLVGRGHATEAVQVAAKVAERALVETGHTVAACCIAVAAARMAVGDSIAALDLLAASEAPLRGKGGYWWADQLPLAVRTALAGGDRALAERLAISLEPLQPLSRHAMAASQAILAEARGDCEAASAFADAAQRWHDFGVPYEEAQALLGQGRCLVALDRAPEAAPPLTAAREIFARLKAKPALAETDALLARTGAPRGAL